jgi:hypothetical protein
MPSGVAQIRLSAESVDFDGVANETFEKFGMGLMTPPFLRLFEQIAILSNGTC